MVTVDLTSEREGATVQGENLFRFFCGWCQFASVLDGAGEF